MLIQERLYIVTLCRVYELQKLKIGVNRYEYIFVRQLVQTTTQIQLNFFCKIIWLLICNMVEIVLMTKSKIKIGTPQKAGIIVRDLEHT